MARKTQKMSISPETSTSLMLVGGILSLLGALVIAIFVWKRWDELGVVIGPRGWVGIIIASLVTAALAIASSSWGLYKINSLTGPNGTKCTVATIISAIALAIVLAFVIVTYYLRALG